MSESSFSPEVIIIGASLAGSAAAIELARNGKCVLLVDKATFPRRKPCGEGLSSRGRAELLRFGVLEQQIHEIGLKLRGYRIDRNGSMIELADSSGLVGIPRAKLDEVVLRRAISYPSVSFRSGIAVRRVRRDNDRFLVEFHGGKIVARFVILADGGNSSAARSLGLSVPGVLRPRYGTSSAWRVTRGSLEPFVTVSLVEGGEIYVTPLVDGRCNVSVLGTKELVQRSSQSDETRELLKRMSVMADLEFDVIGEPLGAGPVNIGYRASEIGGALLVGDACETLDPCGGFGMTHALISGRIAAECVSRALSTHARGDELSRYAHEREQAVRDIRGFTRLTSYMIGSGLGRLTLPLAAKLGVARMISDAVHTSKERPLVESVIRTVGGR